MGSKTRLSSYCTKRANNGVNLVTSRKINTRLARPMQAPMRPSGSLTPVVVNIILVYVTFRPAAGTFYTLNLSATPEFLTCDL